MGGNCWLDEAVVMPSWRGALGPHPLQIEKEATDACIRHGICLFDDSISCIKTSTVDSCYGKLLTTSKLVFGCIKIL